MIKLFSNFKKTKDSDIGDVELDLSVEVEGASKQELFDKARNKALHEMLEVSIREQLEAAVFDADVIEQTRKADMEHRGGEEAGKIRDKYPKAAICGPYFSLPLTVERIIYHLTKKAIKDLEL